MMNRPRRLRKNSIIRELVAETRLSKDMFIYPYFVTKGHHIKQAIQAMPNVYRFSVDELVKDVEKSLKLGINKLLLFGVGDPKSELAKSAYNDASIVPTAVRRLKAEFGECTITWI